MSLDKEIGKKQKEHKNKIGNNNQTLMHRTDARPVAGPCARHIGYRHITVFSRPLEVSLRPVPRRKDELFLSSRHLALMVVTTRQALAPGVMNRCHNVFPPPSHHPWAPIR